MSRSESYPFTHLLQYSPGNKRDGSQSFLIITGMRRCIGISGAIRGRCEGAGFRVVECSTAPATVAFSISRLALYGRTQLLQPV